MFIQLNKNQLQSDDDDYPKFQKQDNSTARVGKPLVDKWSIK